jgi:hypothetical protein
MCPVETDLNQAESFILPGSSPFPDPQARKNPTAGKKEEPP